MSNENVNTEVTGDGAGCQQHPVSPKYQIRANLAGGFGGCRLQDWEDCWVESGEQAEQAAYEMACEVYDSYDGMHGLRSISDIMEEDEVEEDEAEEIWMEERDGWLSYEWREYSSKDRERRRGDGAAIGIASLGFVVHDF